MKKNVLLILITLCLLLLSTGEICKLFSQDTPVYKSIKGPILIDRLQDQDFNIKLFYSNIDASQIETYQVSHSQVLPITTAYISFTEGFIESSQNTRLLDAVNEYRKLQSLGPINYYTHYEEVNGYGFLSLSDGLHSLYIINLSTYEVICPTFTSPYALEKQYVYHVTLGSDAYYLLTAKANSYEAYWYALDKNNFHVIKSKQLTPPQTALKINQYAIDAKGNAYFIGHNCLMIITEAETINLPLSFSPDWVFYANDCIYTLGVSDLFLDYAIYSEDFGLIKENQVNLPNKFVNLINCNIQGSTLYTVTYDKNHPLYRNYITLYDLDKNHIIYCQALKDPIIDHLALLGANYHFTN